MRLLLKTPKPAARYLPKQRKKAALEAAFLELSRHVRCREKTTYWVVRLTWEPPALVTRA